MLSSLLPTDHPLCSQHISPFSLLDRQIVAPILLSSSYSQELGPIPGSFLSHFC